MRFDRIVVHLSDRLVQLSQIPLYKLGSVALVPGVLRAFNQLLKQLAD